MAEVAGYIWETNLDDFVQLVATYVDYRSEFEVRSLTGIGAEKAVAAH